MQENKDLSMPSLTEPSLAAMFKPLVNSPRYHKRVILVLFLGLVAIYSAILGPSVFDTYRSIDWNNNQLIEERSYVEEESYDPDRLSMTSERYHAMYRPYIHKVYLFSGYSFDLVLTSTLVINIALIVLLIKVYGVRYAFVAVPLFCVLAPIVYLAVIFIREPNLFVATTTYYTYPTPKDHLAAFFLCYTLMNLLTMLSLVLLFGVRNLRPVLFMWIVNIAFYSVLLYQLFVLVLIAAFTYFDIVLSTNLVNWFHILPVLILLFLAWIVKKKNLLMERPKYDELLVAFFSCLVMMLIHRTSWETIPSFAFLLLFIPPTFFVLIALRPLCKWLQRLEAGKPNGEAGQKTA
jgi:hypothetical protein